MIVMAMGAGLGGIFFAVLAGFTVKVRKVHDFTAVEHFRLPIIFLILSLMFFFVSHGLMYMKAQQSSSVAVSK